MRIAYMYRTITANELNETNIARKGDYGRN